MIERSPKRQQGVALITVLLLLAVMVTIAATMTGRLTLSLKRTEGLVFAQSVYWYGQATADFGRKILDDDFSDSSVVSLDQNWALEGMVFPLENGTIGGEFKDMRSCFNLNALAEQDTDTTQAVPITQFQALLEELDIESYSAEKIAESTRDWIDSDDDSASQGAEDSIYEARAVPHLAGNNLMVDVSELRAVQGVAQNIYEQIEPYLCAIPAADQKINVNTVSIEQAVLLYILFENDFPSLTVDDFTSLLEDDRPTSGWEDVDDFLASSLFNELTVSTEIQNQLSVTSEYFQLNGRAEFAERISALQILFEINDKKATVIRYQSGGLK